MGSVGASGYSILYTILKQIKKGPIITNALWPAQPQVPEEESGWGTVKSFSLSLWQYYYSVISTNCQIFNFKIYYLTQLICSLFMGFFCGNFSARINFHQNPSLYSFSSFRSLLKRSIWYKACAACQVFDISRMLALTGVPNGYWILYTVYNGISIKMGFCQEENLGVEHLNNYLT